jgi:transcriptional regulator with XRE-family HTH domain
MSGHRPWSEIKAEREARMTPDDRTQAEQARQELKAELAAYERTLAGLRQARSLTQVQLAKALGVSQAQVSRIENQADLYLSTLSSYVEAMGGELELRVIFGDGRWSTIELEDVVERAPEQSGSKKRRAGRSKKTSARSAISGRIAKAARTVRSETRATKPRKA